MKKTWENPNLSNLLVEETKENDTCQESNTKCVCEYYHARIFGGCGGCKAPNYKCKFTGRKPIFTPKCTCGVNDSNPTIS